jgi:hypothetical protein
MLWRRVDITNRSYLMEFIQHSRHHCDYRETKARQGLLLGILLLRASYSEMRLISQHEVHGTVVTVEGIYILYVMVSSVSDQIASSYWIIVKGYGRKWPSLNLR